MDVQSYATAHGISPQRVRQLAAEGKLRAHREGRSWVIEDDARTILARRPLSPQSQADLLAYLKVRTLDAAPSGYRRQRLAARVRELKNAENPAELIRQYFSNIEPPQGPAGAAIVRAAKRGLDQQVNVPIRANAHVVMITAESIARRIRDARMIQGTSVQSLSKAAGVPDSIVRELERLGRAPRGNLEAIRVIKALDIRASKLITPRLEPAVG